MATQSAISAQSFGTSTNVGDNLFSINPLTLSTATTAFVVNAQVTTGALRTDKGNTIRVWYTTTMRTVTAANAPIQLGATAHFVDVRIHETPALIRIVDSDLEPATGLKFHCWVSAPNQPAAGTLSVDVIEYPY